MDIPSGSYGIWPVNLDCDGVTLDYATVQPLYRVAQDDGAAVHFFTTIPGIRPEISINGKVTPVASPGTGLAAEAKNTAGKAVRFVVLTPEQGKQFSIVNFAGRERAILTESMVFEDSKGLRLQSNAATKTSFAVFPRLESVTAGGKTVKATSDGAFSRFSPTITAPAALKIDIKEEKPAGPAATSLKGADEKTWEDAAVYEVVVPSTAENRLVQLDINYVGDAARLYVGDELVMDHYYNGDPMSVALWRIPVAERSKIRLKILPYSDPLHGRLPDPARKLVEEAKTAGTLNQVTVTTQDVIQLSVTN